MKPSDVTELEERIKAAGEYPAQLKTENLTEGPVSPGSDEVHAPGGRHTIVRTESLLWSGWFVLWVGYACEVVTPREYKAYDRYRFSLKKELIHPNVKGLQYSGWHGSTWTFAKAQ